MKKNTSLTIKGSNLETDSGTIKAPVKVNMGRTKNLEKKKHLFFYDSSMTSTRQN